MQKIRALAFAAGLALAAIPAVAHDGSGHGHGGGGWYGGGWYGGWPLVVGVPYVYPVPYPVYAPLYALPLAPGW